MAEESIRWGILGTGRIAGVFARGLADSEDGTLRAVGSRRQDSADRFVKEFPGVEAFGSYEALLASDTIDAVYVSTPHPFHADWAVQAAEAGKHVLCEKPLTLNHPEAMAVAHAVRANGVALMEAFMYRCHPQTIRLAELIREGAIGRLQVIRASFAFAADFDPDSRLFNNCLGGGGILDVGCYPVSMARLLAGAAVGRPFADPVRVQGMAKLNAQTGVDEYASALMEFPGGIVAELSTAIRVRRDNRLDLFGEKGRISVEHPWIITRGGGDLSIHIHRTGEKETRVETVHCDRNLYSLEADALAEAIRSGAQETAAMPLADSLGNMAALDRWREAVGLVYEGERTEAAEASPVPPSLILGRKSFASPHPMPKARIEGIGKPLSRLVIGCDNQHSQPHGDIMWDAYFEAGGNLFDTAFVYGSGRIEARLGRWMEKRALRDDVVIIAKGAHSPKCFPEEAVRQLERSLDRLRCDQVEFYFLHRDNPQVPVGEFVDALHEQAEAGRIGLFGGSNWSAERIDAANAYARKHGKRGFAAVSNNFSLAEMVDPVWPGCIAMSDARSRAWLEERQLPIFAWSSQARGYFVGESSSDDPEQVRCWHSDANRERRRRAESLATELGVEPINIAAAYLLAQPFPVFPLIGPRTIAELHSSLRSLSVSLSPAQCSWLNLDSDEKPFG